MGVDKNFSRRSNSAYAQNSQPRIPTQVCQGHVVTTNLPTLGTNPKQSQSDIKTQEAKDLAALRKPRQTVCNDMANSPRWIGGQSARPRRTVRNCYPNNQYFSSKYGRSVATPWTVRPARTVQQPRPNSSANLLQLKTPNSTGQKKATQELAKNMMNSRLLAPCGWSADPARTVRQVRKHQREPETASTSSPIQSWIYQTA
jgi:hypothetical protein